MLTSAEQQTLVEQLKFVFEQFVETDQHAIVHAVLRLSMESVQAVLELHDALGDDVDAACCAPHVRGLSHSTGSDVRCPHCHSIL